MSSVAFLAARSDKLCNMECQAAAPMAAMEEEVMMVAI